MLVESLDTEATIEQLQATLSTKIDGIHYSAEPVLAARIAAVGIFREIGTANDRLSPEIVALDGAGAGQIVPLESARSDVIEYRNNIGVRIRYEGYPRVAAPSFHSLLHPSLSFNTDGSIREIVVFPISLARIAAGENAELVVVPEWAMETSSAPRQRLSEAYYKAWARREEWTRVPRRILRYCRLVEGRQIPCFTTHDVVDHIANFRGSAWESLVPLARRLRQCLERFFGETDELIPLHASILPFMAGYLLDSMSQPRQTMGSRGIAFINLLIDAIDRRVFSVRDSRVLMRFPQNFARLAHLTTAPPSEELFQEGPQLLNDIVAEIEEQLQSG